MPLAQLFSEWVEHLRSLSMRSSDQDVEAHSNREAELVQQIAETPADSVLAFAIKTYLLAYEDREASATDVTRPAPGEDLSKSANSGILSESVLKDIEVLAPQIGVILGPMPFAAAAE